MNASSNPDEDELWCPIPGCDGYEASTLGRVRSIPRQVWVNRKSGGYWRTYGQCRVLKQEVSTVKGGRSYMRVRLNRGPLRLVHRLVALAFHGEPDEGQEVVRHLNDDSLNNRPENLAWGTQRENMADRARSGPWKNGHSEKSHCLWGHPLAGDNIRIDGRSRVCLKCERRRSRESAQRRRARRNNKGVETRIDCELQAA